MPAAVGVQKMLRRRVVRLVRRLNAAFCHHGVGVSHAKLRDEQDLCSCVIRFNRRRAARAAAADDQDVRIIVRHIQMRMRKLDSGLSLQQRCQLQRHLAALIRSDAKRGKLVFAIVGVEGFQQVLLFLRAHARRAELDVFCPRRLDLADGFLNFRIGIHLAFLLTLQSRDGCKAPSSLPAAFPSGFPAAPRIFLRGSLPRARPDARSAARDICR